MVCQRCGGTLYLDRQSVTDAELSGYIGGRFACLAGCTAVWHLERPATAAVVPQVQKHLTIICEDCKVEVKTRHHNTKRCDACRTRRHLDAGRKAWARYNEKLERLKASA
jgi:hypothetical protein